MFDSLKQKVEGKKTYITALVGLVIALVGVLFGPIEAGPVFIPQMGFNDFWKLAWEVAMIVFLRKGVSSAVSK